MTNEELLVPRYKVIATWPGMDYNVGNIILMFDDGSDELHSQDDGGGFIQWDRFYKSFPHLFRPLAWYEKREEKDMPEYIKMKNRIYKVEEWNRNALGKLTPSGTYTHYNGRNNTFPVQVSISVDWLFNAKTSAPATKEEFDNQPSPRK